MKKFKYLMLIGVSMFACTGLLSCDEKMYEDEEYPVETKIVVPAEITDIQGKWHGRQGGLYHTFSFTDSCYVYGAAKTTFYGMISDSWGTFDMAEDHIVFDSDNDVPCKWSGAKIYFNDVKKTSLIIGDSLTLIRMKGDTEDIFID